MAYLVFLCIGLFLCRLLSSATTTAGTVFRASPAPRPANNTAEQVYGSSYNDGDDDEVLHFRVSTLSSGGIGFLRKYLAPDIGWDADTGTSLSLTQRQSPPYENHFPQCRFSATLDTEAG